jgi:hypothetical protein
VQACAVHKRLSVLRAAEGVGRDEFVKDLARNLEPRAELYVTDPDPRPATAVVCSPTPVRIAGELAIVLVTYDVEENVLWDEPIDGPVYSMFAFFQPPAGLEHEYFVRHYREHAAVARVHHPGIRRYVQDIVSSQEGLERWTFSAISELHFAGPDEYRDRFWRDESSRDVVARDIERFSEPTTAKTVVAPRIGLETQG